MATNNYEIIHADIAGVDMSVPANRVAAGLCPLAENRTFRGNVNATRPSFSELDLMFESEGDRLAFQGGVFQGMHSYQGSGTANEPGILVAVSGIVFHGKLTGQAVQLKVIDRSGDKTVLAVNFAQGEEQVYWQNGVDFPKAWDGTNDGLRVLDTNGQMPVGTLLCYAHGRMVVGDELGRIWVSDAFQGAGPGIRTNMDNFSETTLAGGGYFNAPAQLGQLRCITVAPFADNWFAQGSVVFGYDNGFATMDIRGPRIEWADMRVSFTGAGTVGQRGIVSVNSEIWFRRHDGIGTYRQARSDFESGMDTPISDEVSPILNSDTPALRWAQPMAYFGNRLFLGVWPQREQFGDSWMVYCDRMLVADLARGTESSGDRGFSWEGTWTGLRPSGFAVVGADGERRMLVFSVDPDLTNRVYEVMETTHGRDFIDGGNPINIQSAWILSSTTRDKSAFNAKRLNGTGRIIITHRSAWDMKAFFKAETSPYWTECLDVSGTGDCPFSCEGLGYQSFDITRSLKTGSPDELNCKPFAKRPASTGFWFQFLFVANGNVTFDRSVFLCDILEDPTTCLDNSDYDYSGAYACQAKLLPYYLHG